MPLFEYYCLAAGCANNSGSLLDGTHPVFQELAKHDEEVPCGLCQIGMTKLVSASNVYGNFTPKFKRNYY